MVGYIRHDIGKGPYLHRVMVRYRNMMNSVFCCCKPNMSSCLTGNLITEFSDYFDLFINSNIPWDFFHAAKTSSFVK